MKDLRKFANKTLMLARLLIAICSLFFVSTVSAETKSTKETKIIFGSCIRESQPVPIWKKVNAERPDIFIFLGDNIYADTDRKEVFRGKYSLQRKNIELSEFRKRTNVFAVWDDHDFGINDGGREFSGKEIAKEAFLDFFSEPKFSERRKRTGNYDSSIIETKEGKIQIILLDTRYFRSPLERKWKYFPWIKRYISNSDPDATILGKEQWNWLEGQLRRKADVRLLISSIQVIADEHPFEKWMNFPGESEKLFVLLKSLNINGLIVLSGDRHFAEISRRNLKSGYPLFEITSSSLNQNYHRKTIDENRFRIGSPFEKPNYGKLVIKWSGKETILEASIHDMEGKTRIEQMISLKDLQFK